MRINMSVTQAVVIVWRTGQQKKKLCHIYFNSVGFEFFNM